MQNELLIEIFTEDIPAKLHRRAIKNSEITFRKILLEYGAEFQSIETHISPRRLTIRVNKLKQQAKSITETKRGPKIGANNKAIEGFLKTNNKNKQDLEELNGYYYLNVDQKGEDITLSLSNIIQDFINKMPWPKSMHWYLENEKKLSAFWIRPIRSILCIYNEEHLNLFIESVGLTTIDYTYGHRFLSPGQIKVIDFDDYQEKLEKNNVILDFAKKRSYIEREINQSAAAMGLIVKHDDALLDEIAGLVEYPFIHIGNIDEQFMKLPMEVLSTSMKVHQKYFTLMYPDSTIAPFFITVTNVPGNTVMYDGFERVLRARLSDAMFFYKEDTEVTLEAYAQRLSNVVFHEKLGTISQKIDRLMSIANSMEEHRIISLCKADLVTQMVGEFPELQGIMGSIYAKAQGETQEIYIPIKEHYKPLGSNDNLPETFSGSRVALFDKLDTLVGFIGIGIIPTGSKDPFALRRSAVSIIRLICESKYDVLDDTPLAWYIDTLISSYADQGIALLPKTKEQVGKFLLDKLSSYISDSLNIDEKICNQVTCKYTAYDINFNKLKDKIIQINSYQNKPNFDIIKNAYKRSKGIIENINISENIASLDFKSLNFKNEYMQNIQNDLINIKNNDFDSLLKLSQDVLNACENVLINDPDDEIRNSNLSLLKNYTNIIESELVI